MTSMTYGQTAYYDDTATISCAGSPIVIQSIGNGCNSAVQANTNSETCSPYVGNLVEYSMMKVSCSRDPLVLTGSKRNYVTYTTYASSASCDGPPLTVLAVASDSLCHLNPVNGGGTITADTGDFSSYIQVNCNGNQPIWRSCSDDKCTKCQEKAYSNVPCQLTSAGASVKVECVNYERKEKETTTTTSTTKRRPLVTLDPYEGPSDSSNAMKHKNGMLNFVIVVFICKIVFSI